MLKDLERCVQQQSKLRGLVVSLREIRNAARTAMNSFVHGGLHPFARSSSGFPDVLEANLLKVSHGMLNMSARLPARLTVSREVVKEVEDSHSKFADCHPVVTNPTSQASSVGK